MSSSGAGGRGLPEAEGFADSFVPHVGVHPPFGCVWRFPTVCGVGILVVSGCGGRGRPRCRKQKMTVCMNSACNAELTDARLVELFSQGDNAAFDKLANRYQEALLQFLKLRTRDGDAAADLAQDVFLKAIYAIRSGAFVASGSFRSWLWRVASNVFTDYYRRRSVRRAVSLDEEVGVAEGPVRRLAERALVERFVPIEAAEMREEVLCLVERLAGGLPNLQGDVVRARMRGVDFKTIARSQCVSVNTALGRSHVALQKIRRGVLAQADVVDRYFDAHAA